MCAAPSLRALAIVGAISGALTVSAPSKSAWAQANVDEKGSLTVGLDYTLGLSSGVVIAHNPESPASTETHTTAFKVEYTPIDRLAFDLNVPLMLIKYTGGFPHTPIEAAWDNDRKYHASLQDLELGARYAVLTVPFQVTPRISGTIPIASYPTNGFTAIGRHLKQLHLGGAVARSLDPIAPNLFFEGSYEFTLSEKFNASPDTAKIDQNRQDLAFQIAYAFMDGTLVVDLAANYRWYFGGVDFNQFDRFTVDQQNAHDALLDESLLFVGGDVSYAFSDKFYIGLLVRIFVTGNNTHDQNLYGLNLTYKVL